MEKVMNAAHTSKEMMTAEYWLKRMDQTLYKCNEVLKTKEEIGVYNRKSFASASQCCLYGKQQAPDIRYGICVARCDLRRFPSYMPLYGEELNEADRYTDYGQKTAMLMNEAVVIEKESPDRQWYYIKNYFYAGWVEKKFIGICDDYNEWLQYENMENFLVVTADAIQIRLENTELYVTGRCGRCTTGNRSRQMVLTMGTKLNLLREDDNYNYIVQIPMVDVQGGVVCCEATIPVSEDVHAGYIELTAEHILKQAFKTLGDPYGWGGEDGKRDCSALVMEVYRCFGFLLPRDVSCQKYMEADVDCRAIEHMERSEKEALFKKLVPGTILGFGGHTMIYLGNIDGIYYVISYLKAVYDEAGCHLYNVCMINSLDVIRRNGKTWFESITYVKSFVKHKN